MSTCLIAGPLFGNITLSKILEERRNFVSEELAMVCSSHSKPAILSVGGGKLREAEAILPLCSSKEGEFVILNGSAEASDMLRQEYGTGSARCIQDFDWFTPVRVAAGDFHYIYALNLLNELDAGRARRVVRNLVGALKPGGSLLLSNFAREMEDLLWRESAGRGQLVYRDEADMAGLLAHVPEPGVIGHAIWRDAPGTLVYLEIYK